MQEHLPKDKDPNESQEWGWTFQEFFTENLWYLLAILFLIVIFVYARYRWRVRNNRKYKN